MSKIETSKFTVLTVNDIYECEKNEFGVGGLAELHTLIKNKKVDKDCIVTLNGDFLSASALSGKCGGANMIDILNTMPFDIVTLGNHEFDFGAKTLIERLGETKKHITYLNSNIFDSETKKLMQPTQEFRIMVLESGVKVGIFAVCTQKTPELSKPGPSVYFEDVVDCSKRMIKKLRGEGCDCVLAITHLDIAQDRQLAVAAPGIDIILGGHDHNVHTQYQGETFIHKSGQNGNFLATIEFSIEKKTITFQGTSMTKVLIYPNLELTLNRGNVGDPITKERVDYWQSQLPKDSNDPIALIGKTLRSSTESVRTKETNFANLYADALRNAFDSDIGFLTGGSVRGDYTYYPGTYITKGQLSSESPFPNECIVCEVQGKVFLEAVEFGLSKFGQTVGMFPHFSRGLNIEFDHTQPIGKRIVRALFKNKPLDPERMFTIASTSYLLGGGDGYSMFKGCKEVKHENSGKLIYNVIYDWLTELKLINYDEYEMRLYHHGQYNLWKVIFDKFHDKLGQDLKQ